MCVRQVSATILGAREHRNICMCVCVSACQYDMVGPEGIVESHQITRDGKAGAAEAVDCKWYIRAPPRSKVSAINCCPIQVQLQFKAQGVNIWKITNHRNYTL